MAFTQTQILRLLAHHVIFNLHKNHLNKSCAHLSTPIIKARNTYILGGEPEGKRPLDRPRCRWEDITMYLKDLWCEDVDWIHLAQDRVLWLALVNTVMSLWVL
jgi:hypothetical protein